MAVLFFCLIIRGHSLASRKTTVGMQARLSSTERVFARPFTSQQAPPLDLLPD